MRVGHMRSIKDHGPGVKGDRPAEISYRLKGALPTAPASVDGRSVPKKRIERQNRVVILDGRPTPVVLDGYVADALSEIAELEDTSFDELVALVHERIKGQVGSLLKALRVFVLAYYRARVTELAAKSEIESDSSVLDGEAVFEGTRIPVRHIAALVAQGVPEAEILEDYPRLTRGDILFAVGYSEAKPRTPPGGRRLILRRRGSVVETLDELVVDRAPTAH